MPDVSGYNSNIWGATNVSCFVHRYSTILCSLCTHAFVHTRTHAHTHAHTHTHAHAQTHTRTNTHAHTHAHTHTRTNTHTPYKTVQPAVVQAHSRKHTQSSPHTYRLCTQGCHGTPDSNRTALRVLLMNPHTGQIPLPANFALV